MSLQGTVLICAATEREMDACLAPLGKKFAELAGVPGAAGSRSMDAGRIASQARTEASFALGVPWLRASDGLIFAVTGVGIPLTLARLLPSALALRPDWVVNVGIAGAYPGSGLAIGDVVAAESEVFGDLGMESPGKERFLPLASFPWADEEYRRPLALETAPFAAGASEETTAEASRGSASAERRDQTVLRTAKGCTVNQCTGREETGLRRRAWFRADFETMEGAAVALAAAQAGARAGEARAISNTAATRDMRPENIAQALARLGEAVRPFLETWTRK